MKSEQFPKYPQVLEDDIDALDEYLFEKYNDAFTIFYLEECAEHVFDKSSSSCELIDEYGSEVTQKFIANFVS